MRSNMIDIVKDFESGRMAHEYYELYAYGTKPNKFENPEKYVPFEGKAYVPTNAGELKMKSVGSPEVREPKEKITRIKKVKRKEYPKNEKPLPSASHDLKQAAGIESGVIPAGFIIAPAKRRESN